MNEKWRETTILKLNVELKNQINISVAEKEFKICKFQTWLKVRDEHSGNDEQHAMVEANQYRTSRDGEADGDEEWQL